MKRENLLTILMVVIVVGAVFPESAFAVKEIASSMDKISKFISDDITPPVFVIGLLLWGANAWAGYWQKAADFKVLAGFIIIGLFCFNAENIVSWLKG